MTTYNIASLAGDGIGPEVMREAIKVLRVAEKRFNFKLVITDAPVGWAGIDFAKKALPDVTLDICKRSDSILFGSVGLPDRDPTIPKEERPERAALLGREIFDGPDKPHWITFTSSSTAQNLISAVGAAALTGIRTASIGPVTSATLRQNSIDVTVEASVFTVPGLVAGIINR